jgi:hypothetical protein
MSAEDIENADLLFADLEYDPQLDVFWDALDVSEDISLAVAPPLVEVTDPSVIPPALERQGSFR